VVQVPCWYIPQHQLSLLLCFLLHFICCHLCLLLPLLFLPFLLLLLVLVLLLL
jgi:hypothetical protein